MDSHSHDFHQIVLPLNGFIEIEVGEYSGRVAVGEAIAIYPDQIHSFRADESARFIVADLSTLPSNIVQASKQKFLLNQAMMAFLQFVEKQMTNQGNEAMEAQILNLFQLLLQQQTAWHRTDRRIEAAITRIHQDLSAPLSLELLASIANVGQTQFKKLFRESTGKNLQEYLIEARMKKAVSLLTYTDLPITMVALEVGYNDVSAFSRRFRLHFGQSPKQFSSRSRH